MTIEVRPTSISRWCYSTAKSMVEHYLNATSMSKKLKFINVRLFNIYGTNLKGRVVDSFLNKALKNQDLEIYVVENRQEVSCMLMIVLMHFTKF